MHPADGSIDATRMGMGAMRTEWNQLPNPVRGAIAPDDVSGAPGGQDIYRREGRVAATLPEQVAAPRLIASLEPDGWVALLFEDVEGEHPMLPWRREQLDLVLEAIAALSVALTPSPLGA